VQYIAELNDARVASGILILVLTYHALAHLRRVVKEGWGQASSRNSDLYGQSDFQITGFGNVCSELAMASLKSDCSSPTHAISRATSCLGSRSSVPALNASDIHCHFAATALRRPFVL
jgi:hypothetical protein